MVGEPDFVARLQCALSRGPLKQIGIPPPPRLSIIYQASYIVAYLFSCDTYGSKATSIALCYNRAFQVF